MIDLKRWLHELEAQERTERLRAAEKLSDYVEFEDPGEYDSVDVIQKLISAAVSESDYEIQETLLNGMANAFTKHKYNDKVDLTPLMESTGKLDKDSLLHAIDIARLSGERKYVIYIRPLTRHKDANVRQTAILAVSELEVD